MSWLGDLTGGLIGNATSAVINYQMMQKQMRWMEKMSSTAHQREVADLKAAGLNPILSAGGSGASTPGIGGMQAPDFGGSVLKGASNAIQRKAVEADVGVKEQTQKASEMEVNAKAKAYEWLERNPKMKDLFYSGVLAHTAGMNPTVMAPLMSVNSAATESRVHRGVDWLSRHPETLAMMMGGPAALVPGMLTPFGGAASAVGEAASSRNWLRKSILGELFPVKKKTNERR